MLCSVLLSAALAFSYSKNSLGLQRSLKLRSPLHLATTFQETAATGASSSRKMPWSIGNDPLNSPVVPNPSASTLLTNAEKYLDLGLPVHAIGEINRAQLLRNEDINMPSRLFYLKGRAYLITDNPEQTVRELLKSIAALKPELTGHLSSVVSKISFPIFSPLILLSDVDSLPKNAFTSHITLLLRQALAKLVADYQSKAKKQIKSFTPRRYRHSENGGRDKGSIISDCLHDNPANLLNQGRVEIQESGLGQYGLHALRDFAAGEVIFTELPIFSLSADQNNKHGCSYCWKPFSNSVNVKCTECDEKYCSSACHDQAKSKYHNQLCGPEWKSFLKYMKLNQPLADRSFVICLAIIATAMAVENGKVSPLNLPRLRNLYRRSDLDNDPNTSTPNPSDLIFDSYLGGYPEEVASKFAELCPTLVQKGIGHAGQVLEIADAIQSNSFGGETRMGVQYSAAYQVTAMMNHDCSSNAKFSFDVKERGHEIAVIALKPIAKGEALSITYLNGQHEADEMIEMLRESFGFTCGCKRCKAHLEMNNGVTKPLSAPSKFESWI